MKKHICPKCGEDISMGGNFARWGDHLYHMKCYLEIMGAE